MLQTVGAGGWRGGQRVLQAVGPGRNVAEIT